jgi:NitT/TauT family transport system substrate-binding protein
LTSRLSPLGTSTLLIAATVVLASCGGTSSSSSSSRPGPSSNGSQPFQLRLGYLSNLTHGGAVVGLDRRSLTADLPAKTTVTTQAFNAGPAEVEAILGGALDAAYMGPSPALSAYVKSQALRVVAGATHGGAGLVVRPGLNVQSPSELKGRTIATPELGNTQDVAARAWLAGHGLKTDPQGGGDVRVIPTANATALTEIKQGQIDGAWVPEPWLSRMVLEAHATLKVDEATLWPQGRFATTELVVTKKLLDERPDVVRGLIQGQVETNDWITKSSVQARTEAGAALAKLTSSTLSEPVLEAAWARLFFTDDPLAASFKTEAAHARQVGLVSGSANLNGILDLRPLNAVLKAGGKPTVSSAGLGPQ